MSEVKLAPPILDSAPQYLPELEQQVKKVESFIETHRFSLMEAKLNQAFFREVIPEARTRKFLSREGGPLTTEKEQYEQQLEDAEQAEKFHKAAIKRLLPELKRLQLLKAKADAAKKKAEEEAERQRREEEQAKERAEAAALEAAPTAEEVEPDAD